MAPKPQSPLHKQVYRPTAEEVHAELQAMAPKVEERAFAYKLGPARLKLETSGESTNFWTAYVQSGVPFEAVLDVSGGFWADYSKRLKLADEIRVLPDDMSWRGLVIVTSTNQQNSAIVAKLEYVELPKIAHDATSTYYVKFDGPLNKHTVVRRSDGSVMQKGFESDADAAMWIVQNKRAA